MLVGIAKQRVHLNNDLCELKTRQEQVLVKSKDPHYLKKSKDGRSYPHVWLHPRLRQVQIWGWMVG